MTFIILGNLLINKSVSSDHINTLRTGDANLRLYAYKQFKWPVLNVLSNNKHSGYRILSWVFLFPQVF